MRANMKPYILVLLAFLLLTCTISPASAWLAGWGARQGHDITGSSSWGQNLTNYSVPFTVHYGSGVSSGVDIYLNDRSQADFDDLRFTSEADTQYDYWIEDKVDSDTAHVWVEIPTIGDTETTELYVYYGNSGASAASNGENTFSDEFFDHFDDPAASVNATLWYTAGTGSASVSSSIINLTRTSSWAAVYTKDQFPVNYSNRFRGKINMGANSLGGIGWSLSGSKVAMWWSYNTTGTERCFYVYDTGSAYIGTAEDANYHDIDVHRNHTTNDIMYTDGVLKATQSTQVLSGSTNVSLTSGTAAGGYAYADWMLVRKYNYPEPSHSTWDAEETLSPTAAFSGTPRYGMDTLTVVFTDASTNTPSTWYWDFGDGSHEHVQNPTHDYLSPGVYQVCLNASNAFGYDWENKTGYIEVWEHGGGSGLAATSYGYNITIELTGSDKNLIGYEIPINVERSAGVSSGNTIYVGSYVQSDYDDIKFFQDGYVCDYWREEYTSTCMTAWIRVPFIKQSADGHSYIYALFGNTTGGDAYTGNGTDTFLFFDDFENGDLDRWLPEWKADTMANWSINSTEPWSGSYKATGKNWGVQDNPGRNLVKTSWYWNHTTLAWEQIYTELRNVSMDARVYWTYPNGSASCAAMYMATWMNNSAITPADEDAMQWYGGTNVLQHQNGTGTPPSVVGGHWSYNQGGGPTTSTIWPLNDTWPALNTWHKLRITTDAENSMQYAWKDGYYLGGVTMKPTWGGETITDNFREYMIGFIAPSTYDVSKYPGVVVQMHVDDVFIHQYHATEPYMSAFSSSTSADFVANVTSGVLPLTVGFTDLTTGAPASSWSWAFGDGNTSALQSPSHTYAYAGLFTVNLTATGAFGSDTESKVAYINVTGYPAGGPTAGFTANVTSGTEPLPVQFTDTSATSGVISNWYWDFDNDGSVDSVLQNPVANFTVAGAYTVNLTIVDTYGTDSEIKVNYIVVGSALIPSAQFSANITYGTAPLAVAFTDLSTNAPSAWYWNVTTGSTGVDYTTQNPTHVFTEAGSYTVNLTAANAFGGDTLIKLSYITVVNETVSTGAGAYYAPHQVRWTAMQENGIPVPGVYVSAVPTNTTLGAWSWLYTLFGISESVDFRNSTLTGYTGTDGSITFVMSEDILYALNFFNSTSGIDYTISVMPKDSDYIIMLPGTSGMNLTPSESCINFTSGIGASGGTATIWTLFTDTCNATSNVTIWARHAANNTYINGTSDTSIGITANNVSATFPYVSGSEYEWLITYNNTWDNKTYIYPWSAPITPSAAVPAWVLQWAAVGFLVLLGAVFSVSTVKFGVILIPVFSGIFAYMGWLSIPAATVPFLLSLGALYYIRQQERQVV